MMECGMWLVTNDEIIKQCVKETGYFINNPWRDLYSLSQRDSALET